MDIVLQQKERDLAKLEVRDFTKKILEIPTLSSQHRMLISAISYKHMQELDCSYMVAQNEPTGRMPLVPLETPDLPMPHGKVIAEIQPNGAVYVCPEGWFQRDAVTQLTRAIDDVRAMKVAAQHLDELPAS